MANNKGTPAKPAAESLRHDSSGSADASAEIPRILLHPLLTDNLVSRVKNGERIPCKREQRLIVKLSEDSAIEIAHYLENWIKTCDFGFLADALREHPSAMGNLIIFSQVLRLSQLTRWSGEEDLDWPSVSATLAIGQDSLLPRGVKPTVLDSLRTLLSAWVGALLPGHTVQPVSKQIVRGQPAKLNEIELEQLLLEFNGLMQKVELEEDALTQRRRETVSAFCKRIAEVVQRLHESTIYSTEFYEVKKVGAASRFENIMSRKVRLKQSIALSIARQAVGKKGKVLSRPLVYSLLAVHHRELNNPESVRGHVERAEAIYKEHHKYKAQKRRLASNLI